VRCDGQPDDVSGSTDRAPGAAPPAPAISEIRRAPDVKSPRAASGRRRWLSRLAEGPPVPGPGGDQAPTTRGRLLVRRVVTAALSPLSV